ncbi:MAG: hypothetical protein WA862_14020 [Solirubrobacterales bacterium]
MENLGEPRSYLTVEKGVSVYSSDGQKLGRVVRVMSAPEAGVFDGIVFDTTAGPGGHRFVDAPEVGEIFERGVVLKVDGEEAAKLRAPEANPGSLKVNPADLGSGRGRGGLGRLWDRLSGKG